jgi:hypothetical protein
MHYGKLVEMDKTVTLLEQMEQNTGPVILINKFNVKPEEIDNLLKAWASDASYFNQQLGFVSTQIHRGIEGSCVFINYAIWNPLNCLSRHLKSDQTLLFFPSVTYDLTAWFGGTP